MKDSAPTRLCLQGLAEMPGHVLRPTYDRAQMSPGIVHIGLGNFHRAHQAWYLHRLMQMGEALDWAIIGGGVRAADQVQRDRLAGQDFLTTLIELNPNGTSTEVIAPMIDFAKVEAGNADLIARMVAPSTRIVSLTVTEGGYFTDAAFQGLNTNDPEIQHDVANSRTPNTAFGAMVEALRQRREAGLRPFTGLSCDNLQGNGNILRQAVVSLARVGDPDLAAWIDANCSFPNSMVDCIVPTTGKAEHDLVRDLGIEDANPVTHENFRQWVIEDDFCAGRPNLEKVGVTFTEDVHSYEALKIRILNGGHQILANAAEVLSVETISEAMAHPRIGALFSKVAHREIVPHLTAVRDMAPADYVALIERRFANTRIVDTARRVAFDGSSRHPGFVIPTIRDGLAAGAQIDGLALAEAAWARMCEGTREDGSRIAPNDPAWEDLQDCATRARGSPYLWLAQTQYYQDLGADTRFSKTFERWLGLIWSDGIDAAIRTYLVE